MRRKSSTAAAVAAVLALTLSGCGSDDDSGDGDDAKAAGKAKTGVSEPAAKPSTTAPKPTPTPTPTPSRTRTAKPTPTPTKAAPTPTRSAAPKPAPTSKPGASGVQGTWYHIVRAQGGKEMVLTISGTSLTMRAGEKACTGTINASMAMTVDCGGGDMTTTGTAVATGSGTAQKLACTWADGSTDRFARTRPV
ncbi:hypothetical protein OG453_07830 [Streptomyces sp. NBC_01381]|uniref:hypothetical protein n=1 Tax=Streptomyces sp. NBC_01381 TaxID=2903845 RepID=UPI002254CA68|nr:hypothetical protein [Streptomyces sp. NBC_01381]MCX4666578.1 hypothetical protein [Streptomyces sp. NBC_01381]